MSWFTFQTWRNGLRWNILAHERTVRQGQGSAQADPKLGDDLEEAELFQFYWCDDYREWSRSDGWTGLWIHRLTAGPMPSLHIRLWIRRKTSTTLGSTHQAQTPHRAGASSGHEWRGSVVSWPERSPGLELPTFKSSLLNWQYALKKTLTVSAPSFSHPWNGGQ